MPMPDNNLFDIKKRVTAVKQTRKITRTMELIASSRVQRGKGLIADYQEWLEHMREAARNLPDSCFMPLSDSVSGSKKAYIIFGGSKGLSGPYSSNLLQYAKPIVKGHIVIAVGSATGKIFPEARSFFGDEAPSAGFARSIARSAKVICDSGEAKEIYMIYARGSRQVTDRLFPFKPLERDNSAVIIEPSGEALFPTLAEEYAESIVYEAYLQAYMAEQIARVSAMDNATRNADEIIEYLQATYNRIRQATITQEITTISSTIRGAG